MAFTDATPVDLEGKIARRWPYLTKEETEWIIDEVRRLRSSLLTEEEKDALLKAAGVGMKYIAGPDVLTLAVQAFNKVAWQPRAIAPEVPEVREDG